MGKIYASSDWHSCTTKVMQSLPKSFEKHIVVGDTLNKGIQQFEMVEFLMANRNNPKWVFCRGNAETRAINEIIMHFDPNKTNMMLDFYGQNSNYRNKNAANVIIKLIEDGVYKKEDIYDLFLNKFKPYHIETVAHDNVWIFAHASWIFTKTPQNQDYKNLMYDSYHLLEKLKKHDKIKFLKMYENTRFCFGHTNVKSIYKNATPPVEFENGKIFYIDNGIFHKANNCYFHRIK